MCYVHLKKKPTYFQCMQEKLILNLKHLKIIKIRAVCTFKMASSCRFQIFSFQLKLSDQKIGTTPGKTELLYLLIVCTYKDKMHHKRNFT